MSRPNPRCRSLVLLGAMLIAVLDGLAADIGALADAAARSELESQKLVGLGVGLVARGELVHLGGYGLADRESQVPVDPRRTLFRWASISKPLTAVAAVQLVEAGKLDLDRDVRSYVPEFPDKGQPITTRQLLGHLGGIVHYRNGKVVVTRRSYERPHPFADVVVALDRFKDSPLVHPPGEAYAYSTHGYVLASAVVQRAGGAPFHEQVARRIAEPLGLTTLRPDYHWEAMPDRAVGYRKPKKESSDTDVSWKLGGGGFLSSVEDLTRFALGLVERELVGEKGYEMLWTPQKTAGGEATGYGLGFGVGGEGEDFQVSHSGAQEKTRTLMVVFPNTGSAIVVMTNSMYGDVRAVAAALAPVLRTALDATPAAATP